ncbi:uncharacterized protein LOC130940157 [Arachis stenosperma]|uniref:uncharacterized protein LOC130940157 n=1 Tax=Arachis stenosperma TaxID=217475 RepID=UPI0025AC2E4F|nr:uncharacterized protein LOC130940157 [Arachis stenosperma]XP_057724191.1 uncharacterized protein LOC130940157 [Arachis stenosperma]XP_057724192.1 uncharacterized protein LOC130940157 [Arachis stenosperma]XP_057724193.1 uncharacterized protein LOC130940157 [Arachis stenosperma]XP_057724194.1 uncharacterized protein LOC130940157 [Arachis stenosperma]XP_057724195.1 uncharacterized protein LOC130940157 [Arachis stenosperma]
MAQLNVPVLQFNNSSVFRVPPTTLFICFQTQSRSNSSWLTKKLLVVEARANARTESPKIRNRRIQKKFNGTARNPRLSVFCSEKQLYAMLVDDKNKKCLFYASTVQKSIRNPPCSTSEAAKRVGEALVKACADLNINEISSYDRNGLYRGQRLEAFEIAISSYGFLPG